MPEVSVLLPCRNMRPWLPQCIESLEAQSLRDYEVVAVDDRSIDDTAVLLSQWASRDDRVRVFTRAPASGARLPDQASEDGLLSALDLAVAAARAPLLARMDGDDIADPLRLELQHDLLSTRRDLAGCGTAVELFPPSEVGDGYRRYESWLNGLSDPETLRRDLLVECPVAHPTLMIRRSVLFGLGGYRDRGWPEDYDLILRLHAAGMRIANLSRPLLRWRVRPDRHSLTSDRYSPEAFRRCKVHFLDQAFLPSGRPLVVWGAGKVGKPLARELLRQGRPVSAFVDLDARKIGQEIHGAPVLDPDGFEALLRDCDPYVLAAVGSPGARSEIRQVLDTLGRREIDDYRVCA
ncbi:MAG: glycosyltransferase [Gemmatimonadetes bacterium]|nr:glycosyltransferase [Gemmatimonadota bacterium]